MVRMPRRRWVLPAALVLAGIVGSHASDPAMLVVCAPGYPGSTEQAQPTMDEFSAHTSQVSGWSEAALGAVYYNDLAEGLARLEQADAVLALVPSPFYLEYADRLDLRPILEAVSVERSPETWTLVTGKGAVSGPESLDGWVITGREGYSTTFVRNVALDGWGAIPDTADVVYSVRTVSALRKASRGEPVAVLLDGEQTAALEGLPFASDLERVFESASLPPSLLCVIKDRLAPEKIDELTRGLARMSSNKTGREILQQMRLTGFEPVDEAEIARIRKPWQRHAGS